MALGKIVLVVDDDPAMRRLIAEYLGQHDFRLLLAASGEEMLQTLSSAPVDLVILDMKLAGEDGLALIRELRPRSDVPIIVLTGALREEVDRVIGLELGADDYILKPFSPRELLAQSERCCGGPKFVTRCMTGTKTRPCTALTSGC